MLPLAYVINKVYIIRFSDGPV